MTGGGGANLESIGNHRRLQRDRPYGLGWSNVNGLGSACGAAPVPATKDRVHHFLLVSVNGTSVTVTPTDELGRTFDPVTLQRAGAEREPVADEDRHARPGAGRRASSTYTLTVGNGGPRAATGVQLTDTLPAERHVRSATPSQGTLLADGRSPCRARSARSPTAPTRPSRSRSGRTATGNITQHRDGRVEHQRPVAGNNTASAATDRQPGRGPVDHEDGLARPGRRSASSSPTRSASTTPARRAPPASPSPTPCRPASPTTRRRPRRAPARSPSGTVTCALGTIANGGSATVSIKVTPQNAGTITNTANVTSLTARPEHGQQRGERRRRPSIPSPNLSLTKTDSPDPVLVGQLLTYTLTVAQRRARERDRRAASPTRCRPASPSTPPRPRRAPARRRAAPSPARSARSRTAASATVEIKVTPQATGLDHEPGERHVRGRATRRPPNNSASADHARQPGRRPVADEDRLARPGAGRPAAHLHARRRTTPGPRAPPASAVTDTLPGRRHLQLRHPLAGQPATQASGHRHLRRSARSRTGRARPSRSRSRRRPPARSPTRRACSSGVADPNSREQLRERRRRPSTRPPTCR